MSKTYKIAIFLSTYNGEKYLKEQIESIFAQTEVEQTLFIRDDGSTDRTVEIIKSYQENNRSIVLCEGKNIGVGNSFMQLVYDVPDGFDYYAFSDQDDIWLDNKLIKAIRMINNHEGPVLYTSNQILVDGQGNKLAVRHEASPGTSYMQILCCNWLSGCTMVWNNTLQSIISNENRRPSHEMLEKRIHDVWVAMIAAVTGEVLFDQEALILYRQHDNNVVGVRKVGLLDEWKRKIQRPELRNGRSSLAKEVISNAEDLISYDSVVNQLKKYASCNDDIRSKFEVLKEAKEISKYSGEPVAHLYLKVILGLF